MSFTANFAAINLLVIFGAAVAAMIFGAVWYSPLLAGRKWQELTQVSGNLNGMQNAPATFIVAFILQVLAASLMAAIMGPAASGIEGLQLGSFVGLYFVMPALGTINLFERRPWGLVFINLGFQVGALALMGFIIGQWS
jgi:hypothetical protein